MPRVRRLPVTPTADPIQLVLALPVGIERPRRRRKAPIRHPWLAARVRVGRAA